MVDRAYGQLFRRVVDTENLREYASSSLPTVYEVDTASIGGTVGAGAGMVVGALAGGLIVTAEVLSTAGILAAVAPDFVANSCVYPVYVHEPYASSHAPKSHLRVSLIDCCMRQDGCRICGWTGWCSDRIRSSSGHRRRPCSGYGASLCDAAPRLGIIEPLTR